jgi:hypothetical protein
MNKLPWGLLAAAALYIIFLQECRKPSVVNQITADTIYKTVRDTFWQVKPVPYIVVQNSKPRPVVAADTVLISGPIDTSAVVSDYLLKRIYSDTATTAFGNVVIRDSVTQNKLIDRLITTDFSIPTVTKSLPLKNQVFAGPGLALSPLGTTVTANFTLKTKTEHLYSAGVGLTNTGKLAINAGISWLIRL